MSKALLARLQSLLDEDFANGRLVLSRVAMVNRRHYAAAIGMPPKGIPPQAAQILRSFDEKVNGELAENARKLLGDAFSSGTLPTQYGKVERRWLHHRLRISSALLYQKPAILAHVKDFDGKIRETGYMPKARREILHKLMELLANDCPLASSGRQIGIEELARRLGIKPALFREEPFRALMREKQRALASGNGLREGDIMVGGNVKLFSELLPTWPLSFVLRIGVAFKTFANGYSEETTGHYQSLRGFLRWIEQSSLTDCETAIEALRTGNLPSTELWDDVLAAYRDSSCSSMTAGNRASLGNRFSYLNKVFGHFATVGLLPSSSQKLRVPHVPWQPIGHVRSIAEVSRSTGPSDERIQFAAKTLREASTKFNTDFDTNDAAAFLTCLREEFDRWMEPLPANIPEAVLTVINRRLSLIKARAGEIIAESQHSVVYGRELLTYATIQDDFPEHLHTTKDRARRIELIRQYFPVPTTLENIKRALGNLLLLVQHHFAGFLPSAKTTDTDALKLGGSFFRTRYLELGGRTAIQDLLTPSQDARAAILTTYMGESGANLSVSVALKDTCLRPSEARGHTTVTGHKGRAHGKAIFADLPTRGACISAMQWAVDTCGPLRLVAKGSDRNLLLNVIRGDRVEAVNSEWYLNWFKAFTNEIPELTGLPLLPSMLRPSVLLKAAIENDGRILAGIAVAQHGANVSVGYQGKSPVRIMWDRLIRKFQYHFESLGLAHAASISALTGYTAEHISRRAAELVQTGLGTFCKDPYGKPGLEGQRCNELNCPGTDCPQMEIVLIPRTAAQMQIWKAVLETAAPSWARDREERWLTIWLPWLCLLTVVEEKVTRGPLLKVWDQGTAMRTQLELQTGYIAPCPW